VNNLERGVPDAEHRRTWKGSKVSDENPCVDSDPDRWVDVHGDALFRFAIARLKRSEMAEDLVQETFVAALKSVGRFRGQSAERTWLISILKHKLADHFRRECREFSVGEDSAEDSWSNTLFDERERWKVPPGDWGKQPESALEKSEFWDVFDACLKAMSPRLASAFRLREVEENPTEKICKELQVSPTNLWVMLHRARLRLSKCLDAHWFERGRKN